jgi:hypothetical protein
MAHAVTRRFVYGPGLDEPIALLRTRAAGHRHAGGREGARGRLHAVIGTISTHGINSAVDPSLPYDAIKDFAPVTVVANTPNVIAVSPALPVQGSRGVPGARSREARD